MPGTHPGCNLLTDY